MIVRQDQALFARTTPAYVLGAPISLADVLALPPDGNNYTRDADGRLALVSPDHAGRHGTPIVRLTRFLNRRLDDPWWVAHERAIAFALTYTLAGNVVPESFLGPKSISPDVAVFSKAPGHVTGPHGLTFYAPEDLALVIELLSPSNWRSDAGVGDSDGAVDRPRTYRQAGVKELWLLNPGVEDASCPVPLRGGRFFRRSEDGTQWLELPVENGVVMSLAVPGLTLDLEAFWRDCGL